MILLCRFRFAFLEFNLDQTIIFLCLPTFFDSVYHLVIFLVFNAGFYLLQFDLKLVLTNLDFAKDLEVLHFSLDEIGYFMCHLFIEYFQYLKTIYLFFPYFIILIQNFFNTKKFKLFKQLFIPFKLLYRLNLILFYNN